LLFFSHKGSGSLRPVGTYGSDGFIYEGDWVNDKREGKGKMTYGSDGFIYEGDWVNDKREGRGKMTNSKNDYIYEGEFKNGNFNGYGKYISKQSAYEGEWLNNKRNGYGTIKDKNGVVMYQGEWKDDKHKSGDKILLYKDIYLLRNVIYIYPDETTTHFVDTHFVDKKDISNLKNSFDSLFRTNLTEVEDNAFYLTL